MKEVGATEVRAWANAKGMQVGGRGRLSRAVIEKFNRAHRARRYVGPDLTDPEA